MIEVLAIVSGISTTIGVAKEAVDLFTSIRQILPKKEDKPSRETLAMLDHQKAAWMEITEAMSAGSPIADRIVKKLAWKYGILLAFVIVVIAIILFVLLTTWSPPLGAWFWIPIFAMSCLVITSYFFKNPLTAQIQRINTRSLQQIAAKLMSLRESDMKWASVVQTKFSRLTQKISNVFGNLISRCLLSYNEKTYLENYIRLCALRDTIETFMIKEVVDTAHRTTQTAFRDPLAIVVAIAIERFLDKNKEYKKDPARAPEILREYLEAELVKIGFDSSAAKFDEYFYNRIFEDLHSEHRSELIKINIKSFWQVPPSTSRTFGR